MIIGPSKLEKNDMIDSRYDTRTYGEINARQLAESRARALQGDGHEARAEYRDHYNDYSVSGDWVVTLT